ncbi:MAG TPA: DUF488 family protein [Rhodanobacteraceae bacterium]|nr:DUF488 family protein [Rhodanobacteraceae bacterium]
MELKVKRVGAPAAKSDGARVLVDRLWPRGHSKVELKLDAWLKEIAPSDALRKWFDHAPGKWDGFRGRYAQELDANPEAVAQLQQLLREHGTVTVLFGSHEAHYNNAVALSEYMRKRMPRKRTTG